MAIMDWSSPALVSMVSKPSMKPGTGSASPRLDSSWHWLQHPLLLSSCFVFFLSLPSAFLLLRSMASVVAGQGW